MATFESWGDYWGPGQLDECRVNKLGIHDPERLQVEERLRSGLATADLLFGKARIAQTFDFDHLRAIHAHLLGDIYEWAGQVRVDDLQRPNVDPNKPGHVFMPPDTIEHAVDATFAMLEPARLVELNRIDQVERLAQIYNAINLIHPFFDGNGRASRIFLGDVATQAGLAIDWSGFANQNEVMREASEVGPHVIAEALSSCIVERDTAPEQYAAARRSVLTVASTERRAGQRDPELRDIQRGITRDEGPSL